MREQELQCQISELAAKATAAYKRGDFAEEDRLDREANALREALNKIPVQPEELKSGECRTHHWDEATLKQYGNARCDRCAMQHRYYLEGMALLNDPNMWPESEQQTRDYQSALDRYKCKLHTHKEVA